MWVGYVDKSGLDLPFGVRSFIPLEVYITVRAQPGRAVKEACVVVKSATHLH